MPVLNIPEDATSRTRILSDSGRIEYVFAPMREEHIGRTVSLVSRAMNPEEGGYAAQTLHLHFSARKAGIDDGRVLHVLADRGRIVGTAGLHHYAWGPPENVWLSWFALDPNLHGRGLAASLLEAVAEDARQRNFMNLYIETYSTPLFARARGFYRAQGFAEVGGIPRWLPDGGSMVVFYKDLTSCA